MHVDSHHVKDADNMDSFDLFLDSNYPTSPPKLSFTLDGNDNEEWSFNPNLHKGTGTGRCYFTPIH